MDIIFIISLIIIGCILALSGGWILILKAEAKIEQKIMDGLELKRKEDQNNKILQKYEELLAMEIEWHTYRISTIEFFITKVKSKSATETPITQPTISGDSKLYSKIKALISIYFPHLQDDYNTLCKVSNCSIYFDFIYGRCTSSNKVITTLTEKRAQFKSLSTEFQSKIRKEVTIT